MAVARAAAARGTAMGLSSFASKPVEEVVAANPQTFFQVYWAGSREQILQRVQRARGGRRGRADRHARLDVLARARLGQPVDPGAARLQDDGSSSRPRRSTRPQWFARWAKTGRPPDLTVPNMAPPGEPAPTFFGAYGEWMQTRAAVVGRPALAARAVGRADDAQGRDAGRRRAARGRRRLRRDLGLQPRGQQPRRHAGLDPGAARDRRGGRRPGRRSCSTAASAAAATSSRRWRSALAP